MPALPKPHIQYRQLAETFQNLAPTLLNVLQMAPQSIENVTKTCREDMKQLADDLEHEEHYALKGK